MSVMFIMTIVLFFMGLVLALCSLLMMSRASDKALPMLAIGWGCAILGWIFLGLN